jgi:cob(I)alamin adenosyltransferase
MINSLIATPPDSKQYNNLQKLEEENISWLEKEMQLVLDIKPLEPRFTLPGSEKSVEGAYLDVCRTLSRRAERRLVDFVKKHNREDLSLVNKYINRLSDYLYVLSCNI